MAYREFSSFNGLDRTVQYFGIPLTPLMILLVLAVIIMFIGMAIFSIAGFLFILVVFPMGLLLRSITMNDDKAMQLLALEMKFRAKRVLYKEFGQTLTFVPERYLRYKQVNEQYFLDFKSGKGN